jgi:exosortase H (IPTLxxWG-CTERM-specific)
MLRFFLVFLLIQAALFSAELLKPVQDALIIPFTESIASLSAGLIQWADPNVLAYGVIIQNPLTGFGVAIRAGCNGVEAVIILVAAVLAFPKAPWQHRILGILPHIGQAGLLARKVNLPSAAITFKLTRDKLTARRHLPVKQGLIRLRAKSPPNHHPAIAGLTPPRGLANRRR